MYKMIFTKNFKVSTKVQRYTGFTLAEVLITLGIIGVVAALTIPTLINKTHDAEYKAALKKNYSTLSQAHVSIGMENGDFTSALASCDTAQGTTIGATCLKDVFKAKFNIVKDCDGGATYGDGRCFVDATKIKFLNGINEITDFGVDWYLDPSVRAGFMAKDGTSMAFYLWNNKCSASYNSSDPTFCGHITIDVNGYKNPNTWGKDIYGFVIFSGRIMPLSPVLIGKDDDCNVGSNEGFSCANKYLFEK